MRVQCPHRGIPLQDGICPYHGMRFPEDKGKFTDFASGDIQPFSHSDFKFIMSDMGKSFFTYTQEVKAPYYVWMQNAQDALHLKTVHKDGFANNFHDPAHVFDVQISRDGIYSSHKLVVKPEKSAFYSRMFGEIPGYFYNATIAPCTSFTAFLGVFYSVEVVIPTIDGCLVRTSFFKSKTRILPHSMYIMARTANIQILKEDKALCEKWARNYKETGNWLKGEDRIKAYLRFINDHE